MPVEPLTARRLHACLAAAQSNGRLPSVVAGVVRDGETAWTGAVPGPGPAVHTDPGDLDRQYRIGSITKSVTAVLVMQLRDEGALTLGDPLGGHLPGVPYADRSLRSLLSHASGMHSEPLGDWWERTTGASFDDLVVANPDSLAVFESGATFHYSNLGYALLGEVVAVLRGRPWWECAEELVLRPLGMTRTTYGPVTPHAEGWSVHPFAGTLTAEPLTDTGAMAPAGQAWSTVADLLRYAGFLVTGEDDVLTDASLREMTTPQSGTAEGGPADAYGLGLRLLARDGRTLVGHTGSMPGFRASLFVDRGRRTGAVVLANATTGLATNDIAPRLLEVLEACEPTIPHPWAPVSEVPDDVLEVLGVWHWGNTAYVYGWDGTELVGRLLHDPGHVDRFRRTGDGAFVGTAGYHHGERLSVVRAPDGGVHHLVVATYVLTREPYDPQAPIPGGAPRASEAPAVGRIEE